MFNRFDSSIIVIPIFLVVLYVVGGIGHVIVCLTGALISVGILYLAAFIADKITDWYDRY